MRRVLLYIPAMLLILAAPAFAGPRDGTMAGISRCSIIADDRSFLDCIYGAAQPMRATLGLPPAPVSQQRLVPPGPGMSAMAVPRPSAPMAPAMPAQRPAPKPQGFLGGLFGATPPEQRMTAYSFDSHGMFTVTLGDGSVWRQDGADVAYAHWRAPANSYTVQLAEGAAGGDQMTVVGEANISYTVKRIR